MKLKNTKAIATMIFAFTLLVGCTTVQGDDENLTILQASDAVVKQKTVNKCCISG